MHQISTMEEMRPIVRQHYLDKIEKYLGKNFIIILTGQRRVGKSCILRLFYEKVIRDGHSNVIYIDKEKHEFDHIRTYSDLNTFIDERRVKTKKNYLLIDEVQEIESFEKSIRSYYEEPDIEIIVTGSNSGILSSDLGNKMGGRYKEIYIQALSYEEFMLFHHLPDSDDTLAKYLQAGGLPGLAKTGLDEEDVREYQMDVCHTVLLKDVIMRNQIRNVAFLENLVRFLADNVGKIVSPNSISRYMKTVGETITSTVTTNYIKYLCDAHVIHKVARYDIHGKRLFEINDKVFFEDHGIRNALVGGLREGDIEKVVENVIYNHLVRLGYDVTVGQLQSGEIDFVCNKPHGQRVYVQASYIVADDATREREFGRLRAIRDNYPKYVISMTPMVTQADDNGIVHLHLRRFLTEGLK